MRTRAPGLDLRGAFASEWVQASEIGARDLAFSGYSKHKVPPPYSRADENAPFD